jgi:transcriptional regulator with XRE-family HTH domain/predicted Zn-ribbon and HTH transcriptional regulator
MNNANFMVDDKLSPQQVQLHDLIQHLLIVLSDKEKYIIQNRFALENKERMTLEEIGQHFGVTRERIRQIEKSALRKLERNAQNTNIKILTEFAKALLEKEGGIASDEYFKELIMKILPNVTEEEIQDLHLALVLDADIHFASNTLKYHPYWRLNSITDSSIKQAAGAAAKVLQKTKHVLSVEKLTDKTNANLKSKVDASQLTNILRITKEIKFTDGGVGLYSWRHIHPRTLRDKINYIFQREKKPLHFQKIADLIEDAQFDEKQVNVQAVHNELIRNENFILIGRGIYALKEWGFRTGTVADVIEGILEDGKARTREEITKAVLEQRHVKTITIYLNLKNKPQFARVGRDKYTLAKLAS